MSNSAAPETYEVYAIKYANHPRRSSANFIGGDPHDVEMPLDYFVWVIKGQTRSWLVDTGFDQEGATQRGRFILNPIDKGLAELGISTASVQEVILTHMHYDHAGNRDMFPNARYHLQDKEMDFCTGRCMCHPSLNFPYEVKDVAHMVHKVFGRRVQFHDGDSEIAPGITVHLVGGHTKGMQVVRVRTRKGWMVLASDATHLYANIERQKPFPAIYNVADMLEGFSRLYSLADAPELVIPGHDPEVLKRFPAARREHEDWIVRLDGDMR